MLGPLRRELTVPPARNGGILPSPICAAIFLQPHNGCKGSWHHPRACSMSAIMSASRQQVVRGPSFTGAGYFPDATPAHHADFETGMCCRTWGSRSNRLNEG